MRLKCPRKALFITEGLALFGAAGGSDLARCLRVLAGMRAEKTLQNYWHTMPGPLVGMAQRFLLKGIAVVE
jgi:hypothetical protein